MLMLRRYVLAFLVGWCFNFAFQVEHVTRSTADWLQTRWQSAYNQMAPDDWQ